MPLSPGVVLPKDMDQRQYARWCREQAIQADDDSVATATIQDRAVTFAKIEEVAADTILGRLSTAGDAQELTFAQVISGLEAETWAFSGAVSLDGTVGFFGATPVGQQTSPSTVSTTSVASVSGTGDDVTINANFLALVTTADNLAAAVNAVKTALDNLGVTA